MCIHSKWEIGLVFAYVLLSSTRTGKYSGVAGHGLQSMGFLRPPLTITPVPYRDILDNPLRTQTKP